MFESTWAAGDPDAIGLPASLDGASVSDMLSSLAHATAGLGYLEWNRYRIAARLHETIVYPSEDTDLRVYDAMTQCAARIASVLSISQGAAEGVLSRGVTLMNRLPAVAVCLRDGLVAPKHIHTIVARTDLAHGRPYALDIDRQIADELRRRGSWSDARLRDMVDRIVHRHDPDAVRERRMRARENRGVWTENEPDGMARLSATMTAENALLVAARVDALASTVCPRDPRTTNARASDALFALATGTPFGCDCEDPACPAARFDDSDAGVRTVIHVIADAAILHDQSPSDEPAYLAGYGVISGEHARDLADRDDAVQRPVVSAAPAAQPGDSYRPGAALDSFVRIRDQYCVWPGCNSPAWKADLDHVQEFDRTDPSTGGATTADNLNAKCRFHHNLKTFTDFIDDQFTDPDTGRTVSTVTTPEGVTVPGPAHNGYDLHRGLADIDDTRAEPSPPEHSPPEHSPPASSRQEPTRRRTRLANKHARRRAERRRIRRSREQTARDDPPPF